MTRTLGSFNRRPRLEQHPEDRSVRRQTDMAKNPEATLGYNFGITHNYSEREESTPTNAEKFVSGRTRAQRSSSGVRMAGVELRNQLRQM